MDETRKRFWDTFEQMQEDFDRFFDHYAHAKHPHLLSFHELWSPPADVYDAGNCICVLVEIAGMHREALDLSIEEDQVILRGTRKMPGPPVRGNVQQMQILFGEFELGIPISAHVDAEDAQACYKDGFLYVTLPKIPKQKLHRITLSVIERK
jgi:HSP20 family protein